MLWMGFDYGDHDLDSLVHYLSKVLQWYTAFVLLQQYTHLVVFSNNLGCELKNSEPNTLLSTVTNVLVSVLSKKLPAFVFPGFLPPKRRIYFSSTCNAPGRLHPSNGPVVILISLNPLSGHIVSQISNDLCLLLHSTSNPDMI